MLQVGFVVELYGFVACKDSDFVAPTDIDEGVFVW